MNNWSEFHIGIIYLTGLLTAISISILILYYLRPVKMTIKKITGKFHTIWNSTFKTTIILAGLLGAMSVSFKDCNGDYAYLLGSKYKTALKGIDQVSSSFLYLSIFLGLWLLVFLILRLLSIKKN